MSDIKTKGYSRIPVYDGEEDNIVHILLAKDLLFVDPDDKKPLAEICAFYQKPLNFAEHDKPLNKMLDEFKTGEKGHLAIVKGGEEKKAIGVVTLEDIIEEIIQDEIVDEDDLVTDNKSKKKRTKMARYMKEKEFKMFMEPSDKRTEVPPQVVLAVLQHLSSSVPQFSPSIIKGEILTKFLSLDVFRRVTSSSSNDSNGSESVTIVNQGEPCDFFLLIVEGKVEVEIGTEGHVFESGPFTSFGKGALIWPEGNTSPRRSQTWIPDCTIRPRGDVLYLKIRSATYCCALQASKRGSVEKEELEKHIQLMIDEQKLSSPVISPVEETTEMKTFFDGNHTNQIV